MDESFLSLEEVLEASRDLGLDLSERTFRYYSVLGLLPRPFKRPSGSGDARVHYYPASILERLQEIRSLQNQGYSLKQIKKFFEVPEAPAAEEADSGPEPQGAELARLLLESLALGRVQEAADRFLARAHPGGDEAHFAAAALAYYRELLTCLGGPSQAARAVSPLELERLVRPLRSWRDREWRRHASTEDVGVVSHLRHEVGRFLAGQPVQESRLAGYAQALAQLAARARAAHPEGSEFSRRLAIQLVSALERLADAAQGLLRAVAAKESEVAVSALRVLGEAERELVDLRRVISAYARLLTE